MNKIQIQENSDCTCCSGISFKDCCQGIIARTKVAATPLELMRSRYTAHIVHDMQHIKRSMQGKALKLFDEEKTYSEWFEQCVWHKLEIINTTPVDKLSKEGYVEFKAYYTYQETELVIHERSKFQKMANEWYYVAGQHKSAHIETNDKVGRNDPCPCGSGKKYKKCCAQVLS